jgi:hypothetical protein
MPQAIEQRGDRSGVTIKEIHDAIEEMLKKYYIRFRGGGLVGATPSIIGSWRKPFTYPWIPPPAAGDP